MNRGVITTIAILVVGLVAAAIGYLLGIGQQLATLPPDATRPVWGYPYGHPFGFSLFGLLGFLLFVFLIFGLVRAAVGGPRWGGHGYWGAGREERRRMLEEMHRELHGEKPEPRSERPGPSA